ncbi:MAG: hypothetical protein D6766_05265 [Verrucomicrobia bacterium]|nr:MAG: hypothetical protein D6766_05265 [Verrucomicrobiota bacterium]
MAAVGEPVNLAEAALVNVIDAARNVRLEPADRLARGTDRPVEIEYPRLLQIEWPQRLAVQRVRCVPSGSPGEQADFVLGWWADPPAGTAGANGRWVWSRPQATRTTNGWELAFPPAGPEETRDPTLQGATFRTTRALRVGCRTPLALKRLEVFSEAVWREGRIEVRWDRPPRKVRFEGHLARLIEERKPGRDRQELHLEFSAGPDPLGADQGLLLIRAGPTDSFAVRVADVLWQGTLTLRDPSVRLIALDAEGQPIARRPPPTGPRVESIFEATERAGVAPQWRRLAGAAAARTWTAPAGFSLPGARQGFRLTPAGEVVIPDPLPGSPAWDSAARPWHGRSLRCLMALGQRGWTETEETFRATRAGWIPGPAPVWSETRQADDLEWRIETLVAPLAGSFPDPTAAKGSEALVLARHFRVSNPGDAPKSTACWLRFEPAGPLRITVQDVIVLGRPSDGREHPGTLPVRARWDRGPEGRLELVVAPVPDPATGATRMREAVRYRFQVPARSTHEFTVWVPAVELLTPEEMAALQQLRYPETRARMEAWWTALLEPAARLTTPGNRLGELWQSCLRRLLASLARDPETGEWHLFPPGAPAGPSLEVVGTAALWLGQAGYPVLAAELLTPALQHQGQRAPAGVFRQTAGAFCAQHPGEPDPFTSSLPARQHPAFLRAAADFLQIHPPTQPSQWAARLMAGAEWLLAERLSDGRLPPTPGVTGRIMARSFALDGEGIAALRALADWLESLAEAAPGDSARLWGDAVRRYRRDADGWQAALTAAMTAEVARTPAAALPDGTWLPDIPWAEGHPSSALGEQVEAIANSPVWLAEQGVLPADHPFIERALRELADLLLLGNRPAPTAPAGSSIGTTPLPAPLSLDVAPVWLDRGQTAWFWRTLADALDQHLDPATRTMEVPSDNTVPWTPAEALAAEVRLARWIAQALVRETPDGLELGAGLPPDWPAPGKGLQLSGWLTRFGRLAMSWQSNGNEIAGQVQLAGADRRPPSIRVRLPWSGAQPPRRVWVNGRRAKVRGDGWIELPVRAGEWSIRATR